MEQNALIKFGITYNTNMLQDAVIDTNVLLSALRSRQGASFALLALLPSGAYRLHISTPLIASGGAGALEDFARAIDAGADALLAASVFHFGLYRISQVKDFLRSAGYLIR